MVGLPANWEWDYDGQRWFYKYKPTGHVQYHFPSEGDEFPDYIDAAAPAPILAPEERLESQQQVKRVTSTSGGSRASRSAAANNGSITGSNNAWTSRMSAAGGPVSNVWQDDADVGGDAMFQPESFMFLGPGTYNDVSPLAEEEEEAARRVVAGGIQDRVERSPAKGVSPAVSERTTPQVGNSEMCRQNEPYTGEALTVPATVREEPIVVHQLDSREMPHELPVEEPFRQFDPVGIVAEMPTYDTAPARVETNPDPVEMADNMVLAPIETAVPQGYAELPETTIPVEQKTRTAEKLPEPVVRVPERVTREERRPETTPPLRTGRTPPASNQGAGMYQAYQPGMATLDAPRTSTPMRDSDQRDRRTSLQREASLMMGTPSKTSPAGSQYDHPAVLSPPRVPPKEPLEATNNANRPPAAVAMAQQGNLSHVPSVLKPARSNAFQPSSSSPATLQPPGPPSLGAVESQDQRQSHGVTKYPSALRPARGRPSQPDQLQSFNPNMPSPPPQPQGHGYVPPPQGRHPPSMTPAPHQQQEPRMGIQRVNTVPEQLPSQKPVSMVSEPSPPSPKPISLAAGHHLPYPVQETAFHMPVQQPPTQQPARPASAMPSMASGQYQSFVQQQEAQRQAAGLAQQAMTLPYQGRTQGMPSTAPPPMGQAGPFAVPPLQPLPRNQFKQDDHTMPGFQPPPRTVTPPESHPQIPDMEPTPPARDRRHSFFDPNMAVSPLQSRAGSISSAQTIQTPSPMEHARRQSSGMSLAQSANANYTPSPMSSAPSLGPTPTPPSATSVSSNAAVFAAPYTMSPPQAQGTQQQHQSIAGQASMPEPASYFPIQNSGGQGHAISAQNKLRKKSIGRAQDGAKRNSTPAEQLSNVLQRNPIGQSPLGAISPSTNTQDVSFQGLHRSHSLSQMPTQGPAGQQIHPAAPQQMAPQNNAVPGHLLGRIEEHEEPDAPLRRSSTRSQSPQHTRRSSLASLHYSPISSRRQSLQLGPGQSPTSEGRSSPVMMQHPAQGRQQHGMMPLEEQMPAQGQLMGQAGRQADHQQGQFPQGQSQPQAQMPLQGQIPFQNQKQLQRKPSKGQAPASMQRRSQEQPPSVQMPSQVQPPLDGRAPHEQAFQGQRVPHGQPSQGQIPPQRWQNSGQVPPQSQQPPSSQMSQQQAPQQQAPQGQAPPRGQMPMQKQRAAQGQPVQGQMPPKPPQGQIQQESRPPPGQRSAQGQMPPGQISQGQRQQGQVQQQLQRPPQGELPPRQAPVPGQIQYGAKPPPGTLPPPQAQPPQRQPAGPNGYVIPQGQMPLQGQVPPQGHIPPQVHIPQGQQQRNPQMHLPMARESATPQDIRPDSVPPLGQDNTEPKNKDNKWTKWFKGDTKTGPTAEEQRPSTPGSSSNLPPTRWGGGDSSQPDTNNTQSGPSIPQARPLDQSMAPRPLNVAPPPLNVGSSPLNIAPLSPSLTPPPLRTGTPSSGLAPLQRSDSVSDAGSVSTIEIAEAKSQPVLRPQVIQVQRRSQDFERNQPAQSHVGAPQSGVPGSQSNAGPSINSQGPPASTGQSINNQRPPARHGSPMDQKNQGPPNNQGPPINQGPPMQQRPSFNQRAPGSRRPPMNPEGPAIQGIATPQNYGPPPIQGPPLSQGRQSNQSPPVIHRQSNSPAPPPNQAPASNQGLPSSQGKAMLSANFSSQQPPPQIAPARQPTQDPKIAPAPLFSTTKAPSPATSGLPSQQNSRPEPVVPPQKAPVGQARVEDKWAKKAPAADYSGGDWGDEDDWDY
ncbi:hypothetical protein G7046_g8417 [Stylonectria norvegica]|nr:hypothetical protein G7046_g8417 [Stylonectria norvegica]